MKEDSIFLKHILEEIEKIENSLSGVSEMKFKNNVDYVDMTVRRIEIIGEAAKNLSKSLVNGHPEVEWKKIIGTRDKIIHGYFDVSVKLIWEIVEKDIPELKRHIKSILKGI